MARCGCSGASCSCLITGQGGVTVVGAGSINNPYIITADVEVGVQDTSTINMTKTGDGSDANPFIFQADATLDLNALTDVDTTGATTGQVLAKQADGSYKFVPATTAAVGAISVGNGLQGDGSAGNALRLLLAPNSGLSVDGTGLKMVGGGIWTTYVPVWGATTTAPTLGNGTIEGYYSQVGKTVNFSIELTLGSTSKRGVGAYTFTLPVPPATNRRQMNVAHVARYGVADYVCSASINAGKLERVHLATSTAAQPLSHSVPATLPANSVVAISGSYEAA
jgi:hypothetical protein